MLIHQTQTHLGLSPGEASLPEMAERSGGVTGVAPFDGGFARFVASDSAQEAVVRRPLQAPRPFQWFYSDSAV